ncbi:MAG TPA: peptidoglycan-binding protein [Accumulibacter sp.]|nr:peptidoglycan-binding protein [Accumulibacter sp.]HMW17970.1 peptidoglycan-binding protein [Accumulibacter sp.]HMX22403.1 peptidoglycan-binding protein [Accumulibacter sp.]HMY05827.1 peptidoglycan-binding protein [Accumulibacter sp.]HNC18089.1 peptidoglycan-binding protein [Accumulibacter sp.]
MLTLTQKQAAQSIVNLFETNEVLGDYGSVTILAGDTGHLTFGRSQTTLGSGNLLDLLQRYCSNAGARFAAQLRPWLPRVAAKDLGLDDEIKLHNLLRATADDPVMRGTQDQFFDDNYWQPAARAATNLGITTALGVTVVYDSTVHGSWGRVRDLTNQQAGKLAAIGERAWISAYLNQRHQWLAGNSNSILRNTVYRMDVFKRLVDQNRWGLDLPLVIRGKEVSLATLSAIPPGCYDGPQPGTRNITLQSPLPRGLDVRLVQLGLSDWGADIKADGVFGQHSVECLKRYQKAKGHPVTGVADPALIAQLLA